jgi:regulator of RNase E activity RraA
MLEPALDRRQPREILVVHGEPSQRSVFGMVTAPSAASNRSRPSIAVLSKL